MARGMKRTSIQRVPKEASTTVALIKMRVLEETPIVPHTVPAAVVVVVIVMRAPRARIL